MLLTAGAHACVFGPSVFFERSEVRAGESVQVEGLNFRPDMPVVARLNALDGPVLAELGVPEGDRRRVYGPVTIPAGTQPGNYVLVFTQAGPNGGAAQVPTRALVTVLGQGGAPPVLGREVGVAGGERVDRIATEDSAIGAGALLLVGLGTAGIAMFLGGIAALTVRRRVPAPRAENVQVSRPAS
ncbi:MAG: hypothetical protein ACRD1D_03990 [Acidimicrobiales bacterium]